MKKNKYGLTLAEFVAAQKKNNFLSWIAERHHRTHRGEELNFTTHKYQKDILLDKAPYSCIIKSTQNGITELLIVRALGHAIKGLSIFYVLPTYDLVSRFVKNRLDKSIQNTNYYRSLERAIKESKDNYRSESISLKDIGNGTIAFVGSNSTAGFTEFPADELIIDELDECSQENISMAEERLSASDYRWQIKVSNPTFKGVGIDQEYSNSDKMEWHVKCECGVYVRIDWYKHIVKEIDNNRYVIRDAEWTWESGKDICPVCDKCGRLMDRKGEGIWIATGTGKYRGRRITKLFSGTVPLVETLDRFMRGQVDDTILQRFYNADLGEAFTAHGSKIDREMIQECTSDYRPGKEDGFIIAGIDVGTFYNFVIKKILPDGRLKTLYVGKEKSTDQLILKLREYNISAGVIDAMPETRESRKIAGQFKGMYMCYFGQVKADNINPIKKIVTVQRTPAIDAVKEAILTKRILYPINIMSDQEFIDQMTCSVRVFNQNMRSGTKVGAYVWVEGNNDDHYLLASAYCLIARRLITLLSKRG